MGEPSKAVLITGCSSGIGRAIAERLVAGGHRVYATARRPDAIADLAKKGCQTLALDVLDDDSMRAAVTRVEEAEGAVGVLVNNAGYGQSGAVEAVPIDAVRLGAQLGRELRIRQGQGSVIHVRPRDDGTVEIGGRVVLDEVGSV